MKTEQRSPTQEEEEGGGGWVVSAASINSFVSRLWPEKWFSRTLRCFFPPPPANPLKYQLERVLASLPPLPDRFPFLLLPFLSYIANVASFFENRVQSHWTKERRKDGLLDIVKLISLIRNEFFRSRIPPRYDFVWTEGCGWKNRGSFPLDPFPGWEESVSTSVIRIEEKFKLQPPRSHHSPTLFLLRRQISNRTNERSYLSRQLVSEAL